MADVENLPFKIDSLEIIICSDLLENVLNPCKVVSEFKHTLMVGGQLFIVVPWNEDFSIYKNFKFTHLRTFNKSLNFSRISIF
ncbi:MAG: methyltransferase domain-containing protein [Candidatus Methanomethylicaceae archaeon]